MTGHRSGHGKIKAAVVSGTSCADGAGSDAAPVVRRAFRLRIRRALAVEHEVSEPANYGNLNLLTSEGTLMGVAGVA